MTHATTHSEQLSAIARELRRWILASSTEAGSGHPTSSLSAVELMTALMFGGHFRFNKEDPTHPNNDRLIFSKGHASPLFYALWAMAGAIEAEALMHYREYESELEGHPTSRFRMTEAATGSLGQGLSIGLGMALNARYLDKLPYRTYVLLGDSEMAEGSQWEAIQIAAHYKLDNLVGVLDVNRLGQRGPTMLGHDIEVYSERVRAFGWKAIEIDDGHDLEQVNAAFEEAKDSDGQPIMIVARTSKGKGVAKLEDQGGWHGKALDEDQLDEAMQSLQSIDVEIPAPIAQPEDLKPKTRSRLALDEAASAQSARLPYALGDEVATRQAYGNALKRIGHFIPKVVALDGEVSNSTHADTFAKKFPNRFFEMFVAEQNMVGTAAGLALRGYVPFVSTFAAFFSRAFDQIRMLPYSSANVKFVGSHAGISIGADGPSQMGLEDIAMFRTLPESVVVYPCDAVATERLVEIIAKTEAIAYLRTTRAKTKVIYENDASFTLGGSNVLRRSDDDQATIVAAGITLFEALKAADTLATRGALVRVIDLYSIKPIDVVTLVQAAEETPLIVTVEDHYEAGGIGEAVRSALAGTKSNVKCLAVRGKPRSGPPKTLLAAHEIDADAIIRAVESSMG